MAKQQYTIDEIESLEGGSVESLPQGHSGPFLLSEIPDNEDTETLIADAHKEYARSQKDGVPLDIARLRIRMEFEEDNFKRNMAEAKKAGLFDGDIPVKAVDLKDRPQLLVPPKISPWELTRETPGMVARGLLNIAKIPGVALKMAGESAPTREEREQYQKENGTTWLSTKLDNAALAISESLTKAGDNCIKYYNGIAANTYMSEETQWALKQNFAEHPVLKSVSAIGESGPSFGIAVAGTLLTKNPNVGLAIMGTVGASQGYEDLRAEGVDPDLARYGAAIIGSIEIITEKVPMDMLLKGQGRPFLIRALMTGTPESFQELLACFGQNYVTAVTKDIDPENYATVFQAARQEWSVISQGWQESMIAGWGMGTGASVFTGKPDVPLLGDLNKQAEIPLVGEPVKEDLKSEELMREMYAIPEPGHEQDFAKVVKSIRDGVKEVEKASTEVAEDKTEEKGTAEGVKEEAPPETPVEPPMAGVEGTGEYKERGLSVSIEEDAIERQLVEDFGELPGYNVMNMKEQAQKAAEFIRNEPERARRVAMGQEAAPAGLYPETVNTAMRITARQSGDVETLRELALSPESNRVATILGQRIKSLDTGDRNDPVKAIQDIADARKERTERKGQKAIEKEVEVLQKQVEETQKKLDDHIAKTEKQAVKKTEPKKKYGEGNKLVKLSEYEKIMERRAKLPPLEGKGKHKGAAYIPTPEDFADIAKIGLFHLEAAGKSIAEWSAKMVSDFGNWIKPLLEGEYKKAVAQFDKINVKNITDSLAKAVKSGNPNKIAPAIGRIAEYFVEQGITGREALVDAVHEFVKPEMPEITRRQVMDLISGYGNYKLLSKDEVNVILRDIKGQLQQIAKLEELQAGIPPKKTGIERRTPSDEERRLIQQVEEAKKKYGIKTTDPATQLKSALDAIKKRLENQIKDLNFQIETGAKIVTEKTSPEYDAQAKELQRQRDFLQEINDAIFPKEGRKLTEQQRVDAAVKAVTKSIKDYERRIAANETAPKPKKDAPQSALLDAFLRPQLEALKEEMKLLRDAQKPKRTPEEIALQALKTRLMNEEARLTAQFETGDFGIKEKTPIELDKEGEILKAKRDAAKEKLNAAREAGEGITREEVEKIAELSKIAFDTKQAMLEGERRTSAGQPTQTEMEYGMAQVLFTEYVQSLKSEAERLTFWEQFKEYLLNPLKFIIDAAGASRSICASLDNSFIGRQGLKLFYKGLTLDFESAKIWGKTFVESVRVIYTTLRGRDAMRALKAMIISDPEYALIKKTGVAIGTIEEELPSNIQEKIPVLGRVFSAADAAYTYSAWYMRYRVSKMYLEIWRNAGRDMTSKKELESIGKLTNSMTGRGDTGQKSQTPGLLNNLFFSPRNLKGDIDFLTMHFFDPNMSVFAKKQAAINLFRFCAGAAAILLLADFIDDDSVTWDTNSPDFGKIKIGSTRFSVGGSIPILIVLASRMISGTTTNSITGEKKKLNSGKFASKTKMDLVYDFMENKMAPAPAAIKEMLDGRTRDGNIPTIAGQLLKMYTPLQIQNYFESQSAEDSADMLLIMMAEAHGVNVQSYTGIYKNEQKQQKRKSFW